MEEKIEYMMYLDNLGRLLMGKKLVNECTDLVIPIKNPVIIDIKATNTGGMNIQFYPVMFREFQADKNDSSVWEYSRQNIIPCRPIPIDARLIGQYEQIFAPIKNMMPVAGGTPTVPNIQHGESKPSEQVKVLKLFDE